MRVTAPTALTRALIEIERHVAAAGWDQPVRLFALVPTAELVEQEPQLVESMNLEADTDGYTPIEQEDLPESASLEELLGQIAWPSTVAGSAVVVERVMVPPDVQRDMPRGEKEALEWLGHHPERQEVRVAAAVLRDGARECALRFRSHDQDDAVLSGEGLVPALSDALSATLED